jgi:hypothetical protein
MSIGTVPSVHAFSSIWIDYKGKTFVITLFYTNPTLGTPHGYCALIRPQLPAKIGPTHDTRNMSVFRCNYDFDEEILKDLVQYEDMLNAKNVCVDVYCFSCRNAGGTFGQLLGQIKKK